MTLKSDESPPAPAARGDDGSLKELLSTRGIPRRDFLKYCSFLAGVLALPPIPYAQRIANALAVSPRLPILWLNGQDCNGNIESFLRASNPTPSELILDKLSINYVELLMSPAGSAAEKSRADTIAAGGYVAVVEGAIPTGANGAYCCIGGRAFTDIVKEVAGGALATIAVGTCAFQGGLPAARGGVTGAVGVRQLLGAGPTVIALPGCPVNVENLTATIVHYLTFGQWPDADSLGRPFFGYGEEIHETCPRLKYFESGRFVRAWGDKGHQQGWCLRYMGCQGPDTDANCPVVKFNSHTSSPTEVGAVCLACVRPRFWDVPGGFFKHRPLDD